MTSVIVADKDADIILPPASAVNPIPALPAAVRVDNHEQLVSLLETDPAASASSNSNAAASDRNNTSSFRQLLVFGTPRLRTLILRQVLSDPHQQRVFSKKESKGGGNKNNWDDVDSFSFPRGGGLNIVGTKVLLLSSSGAGRAAVGEGEETKQQVVNLTEAAARGVDVVTYFLQPTQVAQTRAAMACIRGAASSSTGNNNGNDSSPSSSSSFRIHHRLVYVPTVNMAMMTHVLQQEGILQQHNVSVVQNLQLDFFVLESDIVSMEYPGAVRECNVNGTPSSVVTCAARSLLKLQDVTGKIPRIQTYGALAEATLKKLLHLQVNEHLASAQQRDVSSTVDNCDGNGGILEGMSDSVEAMLMIDRKVDMVTPMLTPLTYEGLLDDVFGIDCGFVNVDVNIINPPEEEDKAKTTTRSSPSSSPTRKKNKDSGKKNKVVALGVNASDSLYAEVRNQHVEKFGSFLQNQAMALRQSHAEFTARGKQKDLQEIHQFVKNIPIFTQNLRSLTNHIHLAERIKKSTENVQFRERWQTERSMLEGEVCLEQLEDFIANSTSSSNDENDNDGEEEGIVDSSPLRFLRLLCLQSLCAGGIKSSRYDQLRRDVVQTYGYEYLFVLQNLEQVGLLRRREGLWTMTDTVVTQSPFVSLRKQLILINSEVDTVEPDDVSYVSSGYAPLSVRLVQTAVRGWTAVRRDEILKELLPGGGARMLDLLQTTPPLDFVTALKQQGTTNLTNSGLPLATSTTTTNQRPAAAASASNDGRSSAAATSKKKPVLIVFYLGGVTYMEIAALRFLSKRNAFPFHILIMTTEILNGSKLLQSLS